MTQQEFIVSLEEKGIVLSEKQIEQFEKYYEILVEWNEKMNLMRNSTSMWNLSPPCLTLQNWK